LREFDMPADFDPRRRTARIIAYVFGSLLILMVGFGIWQRHAISMIARNMDDLSDGSALARELRGADDVLAYIAAHPADVSLVAYRLGAEAQGIYLNPDRPRALASTMKLLVLCAYYEALNQGALRPDEPVAIADWENYYLRGTDGDAHAHALSQLRAGKYISGAKAQLQDLAYGMIRFSDNAAADYLMARLGRARLDALPARLGLSNEQAPLPVSGLFLSWESTRNKASESQLLARYRALGQAGYADEVWRLSEQLRTEPQLRAAERARLDVEPWTLTLREIANLARELMPHGSARGYAELMARIQRGELPGSAALQTELQWPLDSPGMRERFDQLGTKGGSVPGILTSATFALPHGQSTPRVLALFFERMPIAVWLELNQNFVHQQFELKLLSDDAFFEKVRERLAAGGGGH
jgi:D-alanyl-D-alanine carboxypeptidase